jgi:diacylglycerol kinase family enzyme
VTSRGGDAVTVIVNRASGSADATESEHIRQAFAGTNVAAELALVNGPAIAATANRAASAGHTLVAAGGDGTVSAVAAAAAARNVPFGVIPIGTLNHFAKDAGIPLDVEEAAQTIAAGRTEAVDIGEVNGRTFLNNLSLGFYVRILKEREEQRRRGRRKWTGFAIGLAHAWLRYRTMTVRLEVDGRALVRRTPFVFVGNGDYQAEGVDIGRRSSLRGGRLSVYVAPECGRFDLMALWARAVLGRLTPDVKLEAFSATELTIETAARRVAAAADGELITLRPPIACAIRPGALRLLLPGA